MIEPGSLNWPVAGARQVMDLFATQTLAALAAMEHHQPDAKRELADRLLTSWRELELDDVAMGSYPTDAQRVLAAAVEIAREDGELTVEAAVARANQGASPKEMTSLKAVLDAYPGQFSTTRGNSDSQLRDSLTMLAQAGALRDVVQLGARVTVTEETRRTAEDMVKLGYDLVLRQEDAVAKASPSVLGRLAHAGKVAGFTAVMAGYATLTDVALADALPASMSQGVAGGVIGAGLVVYGAGLSKLNEHRREQVGVARAETQQMLEKARFGIETVVRSSSDVDDYAAIKAARETGSAAHKTTDSRGGGFSR
jgi:hypothetical protein